MEDIIGVTHLIKITQTTKLIRDFSPQMQVQSKTSIDVFRTLVTNEKGASVISTASSEIESSKDEDQEGLYYSDFHVEGFEGESIEPIEDHPKVVAMRGHSEKNDTVISKRLTLAKIAADNYNNANEDYGRSTSARDNLGGMVTPPETVDTPSVVQPDTVQQSTEAAAFQHIMGEQRDKLEETYDYFEMKVLKTRRKNGDLRDATTIALTFDKLEEYLDTLAISEEECKNLISNVQSAIDKSLKQFK